MNSRFFLPDRKMKRVYRFIQIKGTVSKQAIMDANLQLSSTTLTRILNDLVSAKLIEETGFGQSTGGRKPILYRIRAEAGHLFGLEITRTFSRLALFDVGLKRLESIEWPMNEQMTPEVLVEKVKNAVLALLEKHQLAKERVLGMGIGSVGPLDRKDGIILNPVNFPSQGWNHVPICSILENILSFPVILDNGTHTSLLGESQFIPNRDKQQLVYIHIGTGMRSAVMANGSIVYGAIDKEGAIGQMIIQFDGLPPRISGQNYGSIESYVSTYALEMRAKSMLKQGRNSLLQAAVNDIEEVAFHHLTAALEKGDDLAKEIFLQAGVHLGIGLSNVLNIFHPDVVILGGPIISSNSIVFAESQRVALEKTYYYPDYQPRFIKSRLGDDAGVTGAASLLLSALIH